MHTSASTALRDMPSLKAVKHTKFEFEYHNSEISRLICSCFCSYNCKHEVAVMLQLRETIALIEKYYADEYDRTGYFAAVHKGTLSAAREQVASHCKKKSGCERPVRCYQDAYTMVVYSLRAQLPDIFA